MPLGLSGAKHPRRPAPAARTARRCVRVRAGAAVGARHRHRRRLEAATCRIAAAADCRRWSRRPGSSPERPAQTPGFTQAFTLFNTHTPQIYADIDRTKAELLQVPIDACSRRCRCIWARPTSTTSTCSAAPIRCLRRRTTRSALTRARRREPEDAQQPRRHGADRLGRDVPRHHRAVPRAALQPVSGGRGAVRPGATASRSGQAIAAIEKIAKRTPAARASASNGPRSPCRRSSPATPRSIAFGLAVVFVFLLLAALYESWLLPLAVVLIVPMCMLAAMLGVNARGLDRNILVEIGLRGAGRAGGEERDPDRRVRPAGRGAGHGPVRGGGRRGADPAAADPDDVARLHPRRACRWRSPPGPAPRCASRSAPRCSPGCSA